MVCSTAVMLFQACDTITAVASVEFCGSTGCGTSDDSPSRLTGADATRNAPSIVFCVAVEKTPENARWPTGPRGLTNLVKATVPAPCGKGVVAVSACKVVEACTSTRVRAGAATANNSDVVRFCTWRM